MSFHSKQHTAVTTSHNAKAHAPYRPIPRIEFQNCSHIRARENTNAFLNKTIYCTDIPHSMSTLYEALLTATQTWVFLMDLEIAHPGLELSNINKVHRFKTWIMNLMSLYPVGTSEKAGHEPDRVCWLAF